MSLAERDTLHAPFAKTEPATSVTTTEVVLHGVLDPEAEETKYYFQYGLTTSYEKETTPTSIGISTSDLEESKTVAGLEAGKTYHFRIVATSSIGTTYGEDNIFGGPGNTALPIVSSTTPDQNVPETTTTGSWTNSPTSYSYQWERCNAEGKECANISGATSSTYTPVAADAGHELVAKVTATNSFGSNSATSVATSIVKAVGELYEYEIPPGSEPGGITQGSDGKIWFTEELVNYIGTITTSGSYTGYRLPTASEPARITGGPGGGLWYTDRRSGNIGNITTSGTITEYTATREAAPNGITAGPDGNLWLTVDTGIVKMTTSGTATWYALPKESLSFEITSGPDKNLWFTDRDTNKIGKITTSGTVTEYALPAGSNPEGITSGPDGNLWFTDWGTSKIGKITTSGTVTEYTLPEGSKPISVTQGPDGNLWFTDWGTSKIGKITTSGTVTEYTLPEGSKPVSVTQGPGSNLWFTEPGASKIGEIVP